MTMEHEHSTYLNPLHPMKTQQSVRNFLNPVLAGLGVRITFTLMLLGLLWLAVAWASLEHV